MSRTSLITIFAFVAGVASGYFVRGATGMLQRATHDADLTAIERLNQEDIDATVPEDSTP